MSDKIRVLYVDDEPSLLELTREFLELNGEFNVDTATSAREALDSSSINSYDLIISDYQMPDMDGIVFLKAARERFGDIPFILFTGRGREEIVIEAINHGADFYLQKGGDVTAQFAELAHKIRQAVRRRTTERELRRSEARLRSFFETTRESVTLVDEDGKVTEWNAATERITGIRKEEALGTYLWDLTFRMLPHQQHSEERRALIEERIRASLRTGIPVFEEPRVIESQGPDGSRIYTRQTIFPIRTDKGFAIGSIAQDITSEKQAENALRESEKKYRDLAELLPEVVFEVDTRGNLLYTNHTAFQYFRYTEEDFKKGLNIMQMLAPGDVERAGAAFRALVEGKGKLAGVSNEYTALRKDGTTFPIAIYPEPVIADGSITGLRGVIVDITERRNAEEALRESEERFRGMAERSSDLILVLNKAMSPTYVSPSVRPILGYAPEELVGQPPEFANATIFSETGPALMEAVKATMSGRLVESVELRLSRKDKTPVMVSMLAVPILRDGTLDGVQVSMRDITRLVVTQSALKAMVGSMVGTTGLDSLQKIAGNLSTWLEADCVMVGEIQPDNRMVRVLSMQLDGKAVEDYSYALTGTPCENVKERGFCHYPDEAVRLFPESKDLVELNIRGYIGTPLKKSDGGVIGILCALFRRPFPLSPTVQEILEILAVKAGAEIERSQMDRALRQSEEKYRSIVETSPDMIWETDLQGNFHYISPMVQAILGYTPEEVIDKSILDLVPEEGRSAAMQELMQMISSEGALSPIEFPARHCNGSDILLEIRPARLTGTDGMLKGLRGVAVDITERKRAGEALRESEEKFRSFVENASEIIFSLTPDGIFTYVSPNWTEWLGHDTRDVIGRNAADFIHPDDSTHLREVLMQTLATGKKAGGTEYRIRHKDGSWRWHSQNNSLIRTPEGTLAGIQGISHDITDRKRAEAELHKSRHLLSEALDMAHMADWELDAATRVFTFNDPFYALYGTTAGREGGYQMAADVYTKEFIHPDDRYMIAEEIARALSAPDPGYFSIREHRIIRRDGEVRWITVRIRITRDAQGRTISIHGANQDLTDRKKVEEALRQANKKLNLLSGITRHDINNQLTVLNGFVTLLKRDLRDTPHEKYTSRITNASKNIVDMIQFTKEYEMIGTEALVWQDLTTVITAAGNGVIPGQISLENELPAGTEVFADPMLEKVFFNLLDNAVRHGERVTQIRVSSRTSGEDLVIVWEDNGVGIPAEEKERIFDRGFGKNTGLGMFLVREILSLKGISIVETGEPGRGARFEMTVPRGAYRIRS